MDNSWRSRSTIQGNICPSCFKSHFPFCPPLPISPFTQNPRFQSHTDHFFPSPPPYDPMLDHRGRTPPPNNIHRPPVYGFGDPPLPPPPRPWHSDPSFDRDPYGRTNSPGYDYGGSVGSKRMRIDESNVNPLRVLADDERRLKLIRDHGGIAPPSSEIYGFGTIGGGELGQFEGLAFKRSNDYEVNYFRDRGLGTFDRNRSSFLPGPGSNPHYDKEEEGLAFDQPFLKSNRNEDFAGSRYSQVEKHVHQLLHCNGHGDHPIGHFTNVELARQSYHEGIRYDLNPGDDYLSVAQKADMIQASHMSLREPQYPYPTERQGTLGSSSPHYKMNYNLDNQLPQPSKIQHPMEPRHDFQPPDQLSNMRQSVGVKVPSLDGIERPVGYQNFPVVSQYGPLNPNNQGGHLPNLRSTSLYDVQPPLPASPPPPLPVEPPIHTLSQPLASTSPSKTPSSLFPIPGLSSATIPSSYPSVPEAQLSSQTHYPSKQHLNASTGVASEEFQAIHQASNNRYSGERQPFPARHLPVHKPKFVDASHIFKHPHRANRPDHIVIILRGLPGSGKSYLAKMLRDLEVENGGEAPRIHSMDDYFMTEVEKGEESESSGSIRGKKPVIKKKVMEYCYEPEMEEGLAKLKEISQQLEPLAHRCMRHRPIALTLPPGLLPSSKYLQLRSPSAIFCNCSKLRSSSSTGSAKDSGSAKDFGSATETLGPYLQCPLVLRISASSGSGKSYLAKMLRDLEVENGGEAPRIHSMDDYFMTEVEKGEESESSGSIRGKKPVIKKKVMEYCYEPEMEEGLAKLKEISQQLEPLAHRCMRHRPIALTLPPGLLPSSKYLQLRSPSAIFCNCSKLRSSSSTGSAKDSGSAKDFGSATETLGPYLQCPLVLRISASSGSVNEFIDL
ncbi:unnamed protein product [Ilex paraguariensis]|uniref:P-loop containing nucleoside triphosphate hydrolases superfamily protein n=1 Tax=Ilex paraguariensis TaxID=185542 RepID=A0ABC8SFR6_9AQUA